MPEEKYCKDYSERMDKDTMYEVLADCRTTKGEMEIDVMRWATKITVEGHILVLKSIKEGMRESDLESLFYSYCCTHYSFLRVPPYGSIVGCGHTAATLHYIDNNKPVINGQTMLIDQAH